MCLHWFFSFSTLGSSYSNLCTHNHYTHTPVNRTEDHTHLGCGLKALYCSSRLLYVQKRWPAKTFLVGGDTEPQIDCFLDTFFSCTVQSTTTTKYMLLPLQKIKDLENVVQSEWKTDCSDLSALFSPCLQLQYGLNRWEPWHPPPSSFSVQIISASLAGSEAARAQIWLK